MNRNDDLLKPDLGDPARATEFRDDDKTGERPVPKQASHEVGEGVGGIAGVAAGAAIGSLGGPIGTVIGGIAGAIGGWWAGRSIADAAYSTDDDAFYREHYEKSATRSVASSYDDARPAYQLGHVAGQNPEYRERPFQDVERDLQKGWERLEGGAKREWSNVRAYAHDAYNRSRSTTSARLDSEVSRQAATDAGSAGTNAGFARDAGASRQSLASRGSAASSDDATEDSTGDSSDRTR